MNRVTAEQLLDSINLSHTYQEVVDLLGQPLNQTQTASTLVLRYGSNAPSLAHYLHFQNNQLVFKSISTYTETSRTLQQFINQYGPPAQSLLNTSTDTHDSLRLTTHIWPNQGIAVTSIGQDPQNQVTRLYQFAPTTLEQYFQTWGKDLVGHQVATISGQTTALVTPTPAPTPKTFLDPIALGAIGFSVALLLIFLFLRRLVKRGRDV